jgi:hypothetical protein
MKELNIAENQSLRGLAEEKKQSSTVPTKPPELTDELLDLLPKILWVYITQFAERMTDAPREFLLLPFIAMIGGLIGNRRYVKTGVIKTYPVIWTVVIAVSSLIRKTTSMSVAKKPFKRVLDKWEAEHHQLLIQWEHEKKQAEEAKEKFETPKPIKRRLYAPDGFSDLTFWQTMKENLALVSFVTEFTALIKQLSKTYTGMGDFILSLFDAEDNMRRLTRMGGDIELKNPVWCMIGASTLSSIRSVLSNTDRGNGFLQRILVVTYEGRPNFKAMTELPAPDTFYFSQLSDRLLEISDLDKRDMHLTREAKDRFTEWSHDFFKRSMELEKQIPDIGGYSSRINVYGLKFAMIFQILTDEKADISLKNMEGAIALCEWCFQHQQYMLVNGYVFNRYQADRNQIVDILKKNNGYLSRTKLMNLSNFDKEQLDRALENEIEAGRVEAIKIETGGRPRYDYQLIEDGGEDV